MAPNDPSLSPAPTPETDPERLERAILSRLLGWQTMRGEVTFPCIPALAERYAQQVQGLARTLGQPFDAAALARLQALMAQRLEEGYGASPYSQLLVRYQTVPGPEPQLSWKVETVVVSSAQQARHFLRYRPPEVHDRYPDAKVEAIAATLGDPANAPILDVGAGPGRNAIALARRGHPVVAIEPNEAMAQQLRTMVERSGQSVQILERNILDGEFDLARDRYAAILLTGVVPYFDQVDQLRLLFQKLAPALRPGGLLLFDAFVGTGGWVPTRLVREWGRVTDAYPLAAAELEAAIAGLPLVLVSDEDALAYERDRLSPEARQARPWFDRWASGSRLFQLPRDRVPPMSLRWRVYERSRDR
jgi:SAM-dependent methyltransferase